MAGVTSNCLGLLRRSASLGSFQWLQPCDLKNSIAFKPPLVAFARGKKAAKKQTLSKKDIQRAEHKEYLNRLEAERAYEGAIIKVVRRGEPLDPEMLNPQRKRERIAPSSTVEEERVLMVKDWSRFTMEQSKQEHIALGAMVKCRNKALKELKKTSLPLYEQALRLRTGMLPLEITGPAHTPPIADYQPPEPADM